MEGEEEGQSSVSRSMGDEACHCFLPAGEMEGQEGGKEGMEGRGRTGSRRTGSRRTGGKIRV